MKFIYRKHVKVAGIAIFMSMSLVLDSCKKDLTETTSNKGNAASQNLTSDVISGQLSKFWTNYSAFKKVDIAGSSTPNLNGLLNESEMLSTLHYSLNVALTNVDTTYETVTTASFTNDIALTNENSFTYGSICTFFDKTLQSIKAHTSATEITERNIHEISLELVSYNTSTVSIKTTVKFSGGELYATSDLGWTASESPYLAKFTSDYQIPWVAKSTAEQGKQGAGHGKYNYFRFLLDSIWNVTPSTIGTIQSKLSNGPAAHDILSNNALC